METHPNLEEDEDDLVTAPTLRVPLRPPPRPIAFYVLSVALALATVVLVFVVATRLPRNPAPPPLPVAAVKLVKLPPTPYERSERQSLNIVGSIDMAGTTVIDFWVGPDGVLRHGGLSTTGTLTLREGANFEITLDGFVPAHDDSFQIGAAQSIVNEMSGMERVKTVDGGSFRLTVGERTITLDDYAL